MRLLDARALIHEGVSRLVDDDEVEKPHYAILSHTWGKEEVLFEDIALGPNHEIDSLITEQRAALGYRLGSRELNYDFDRLMLEEETCPPLEEEDDPRELCKSCRRMNPSTIRKSGLHVKGGWKKVWSACLQACRDGYDYIWIDTCCIDKSSSTELSEALNSMLKWYAESDMCYTYLEDCRLCPRRNHRPNELSWHEGIDSCTETQIRRCRWLTRGWTLQELIAPAEHKFFDHNWTDLGRGSIITSIMCNAAGINTSMIYHHCPVLERWESRKGTIMETTERLKKFTVAEKMSWAAHRRTTRIEDRAYSLFGLFGVSMPLLYGEGNKAFFRLQEEIIKKSNDDSIFAWEFIYDSECILFENQLLAPSPEYFSWWLLAAVEDLKFHNPQSTPEDFDAGFEISQKALHIIPPFMHWDNGDWKSKKRTNRNRNRSRRDNDLDGKLGGNAEKGRPVKNRKAIEESRVTRELSQEALRRVTHEHNLSEEDLFDEGLFDEDSIGKRTSAQHGSRSNSKFYVKRSHAFLRCRLKSDSEGAIINIALRLSHTYIGDRYVNSQIVSEKPWLDEDLRRSLGLREISRLALYSDRPKTTAAAQAIIIRRDRDDDVFF